MKKFSRSRTLTELQKVARKQGWRIDTLQHDKLGSDFVTLHWPHAGKVVVVAWNTFNGRFIIEDGGDYITERSPDDCRSWYGALLDLLFVTDGQNAKSKRKAA